MKLNKSNIENPIDILKNIREKIDLDAQNWQDPQQDLKEKKFDSYEEYFRFLYCYCGEEFIKQKIEIDLIKNLDDEEDLKDSDLEEEYLFEYAKHNFLLYKKNDGKAAIVVDILSERLFDFLDKNIINNERFNDLEIDLVLGYKNQILDKINQYFRIDLMKSSVQSCDKDIYCPSALDFRPSSRNSIFFLAVFLIAFLFLSIKSLFFSIFVITTSNIIYLIPSFYKFFLGIIPEEIEKETLQDQKPNLSKPIYTILLPILFEEKLVIDQLISRVKKINYPLHQLDIKILLEEGDFQTKNILNQIKLEYNFDVIVIPDGSKYLHPQTKARASNYGLRFARGDYLTIYDADNAPNPNQIQDAITHFIENQKLISIQYALYPYNNDENLLTKCYSMEFDLWYKVFIKKQAQLNLPINLGGTSNHFKMINLIHNMWDPYNVTEDADLGIRFYLQGHHNDGIKIISDKHLETKEEAPITLEALIKQRSRWIKGFIQTFFVHFKNYEEDDKWRFRHWLFLFIGSPILSNLLIMPVLFEFFLISFLHKGFSAISILGGFSIVVFLIYYALNVSMMYLNLDKISYKSSGAIFFFPIYSIILNVIASYKALWQLFSKPFKWEKTQHGITQIFNKE
jgi:cellulose synthase/poly-beta-1,6-N-acetylglucosamine synthase-like glycosyltransferase